jgi:uncharacterized coiled-coil DUF342 family protein
MREGEQKIAAEEVYSLPAEIFLKLRKERMGLSQEIVELENKMNKKDQAIINLRDTINQISAVLDDVESAQSGVKQTDRKEILQQFKRLNQKFQALRAQFNADLDICRSMIKDYDELVTISKACIDLDNILTTESELIIQYIDELGDESHNKDMQPPQEGGFNKRLVDSMFIASKTNNALGGPPIAKPPILPS